VYGLVSLVVRIIDSIFRFGRVDYLRDSGDSRHSDYSYPLRSYPLHPTNNSRGRRVVPYWKSDLRLTRFLGGRDTPARGNEIIEPRRGVQISDPLVIMVVVVGYSPVYRLGTFPHVGVDCLHSHQTVSRLCETEALH